jgi:hypothetical protein
MTELPEEVRRELEDILRDNIPSYAVTIKQLVTADPQGRTHRQWARILEVKVENGEWAREKKGSQFYYWPVKDEAD